MGRPKKEYDIEPILKVVNFYQSLHRGCFEAHKSMKTLFDTLKQRGQTLEKIYFFEKVEQAPANYPYKPTLDFDLDMILKALNKTKSISLAALELGTYAGHLHILIKVKGYKLSKKWEVVDL